MAGVAPFNVIDRPAEVQVRVPRSALVPGPDGSMAVFLVKDRRTMPEILLFTEISWSGRIAPTARAFSTTSPRVTRTVLKPGSADLSDRE